MLGDLFIKKTIKGVPKSEENLRPSKNGYHMFGQNIKYQYPRKIKLDSKYLQEVDRDYPILSYTSSVGEIGLIKESFYRSGDNGAFQGLFPKSHKFNFKELKFIESIIKKQFDFFGYGTGMSSIMELQIQLPTRNGLIDFDFMNRFVAELEAERVAELEAERVAELEVYLMSTGLKDYTLNSQEIQVLKDFESGNFEWGEYKIEDILQWQPQKEIDPLKLEQLKDKTENIYPFYGQSTTNNGIISYNQLTKEVLNNKESKSTILIHSNNQNIVYLETSFYLKDGHGATSVLQSQHLNKINQMCIIASIDKVIKMKYSYNAKATKIELKNTIIEIPTKNSQPDYALMETFISAIQKLVIKDVVLFADRKIAATKMVIEK